ncbi:MAG: Na(+) H(+) antiporter subunit D, partial [uncultured Rubrobacteraceae bacterium]
EGPGRVLGTRARCRHPVGARGGALSPRRPQAVGGVGRGRGPRGDPGRARAAGRAGRRRRQGRDDRGRMAGGGRDNVKGRRSGRHVRARLRRGDLRLPALRGSGRGALADIPGVGRVHDRGAHGTVSDGRCLQLLRVLRGLHDRGVRAGELSGARPPGARGFHLRRHKPAGLGRLPHRGRRALPRHRQPGHGDHRRADRSRAAELGDRHSSRHLRGFQPEARTLPVPLLAAGGLRREPPARSRHPLGCPGEHRKLWAAALRRRPATQGARVRVGRRGGPRDREHNLRGAAGDLAPRHLGGPRLLSDRSGRLRPRGPGRRRNGRLRGGRALRGRELTEQGAALPGRRPARSPGRPGVRRRGLLRGGGPPDRWIPREGGALRERPRVRDGPHERRPGCPDLSRKRALFRVLLPDLPEPLLGAETGRPRGPRQAEPGGAARSRGPLSRAGVGRGTLARAASRLERDRSRHPGRGSL